MRRLVVMNVPHPTAFAHALRTQPRQWLRSWYVAFFQLPWLPEWWLRRRGAELLRDSARPGSFDDDELPVYRAAFRRPGVASGMLAWYRALRRHRLRPRTSQVAPPTLILWGMKDAALLPELAAASLAYCTEGELLTFDDATHWVQRDEHARVTAALIDWCSR